MTREELNQQLTAMGMMPLLDLGSTAPKQKNSGTKASTTKQTNTPAGKPAGVSVSPQKTVTNSQLISGLADMGSQLASHAPVPIDQRAQEDMTRLGMSVNSASRAAVEKTVQQLRDPRAREDITRLGMSLNPASRRAVEETSRKAMLERLRKQEQELQNEHDFLWGFEQDMTGGQLYYTPSSKHRTSARAGAELAEVRKQIAELEAWLGQAEISEADRLRVELEAALEKQRNAQVMYNRYVDDGAGSAYASLPPEERRAIMAELNTANERVKTLERQLEVEEYRERYGGLLYTEDTFWNQAAAHYRLGRIGQDINAAYSAYLADPTEANLDYANGLAALERQFTENNQLVLDEEGAILPWLSKTAAGYLPQLFDQTKARVAGGAAGALGGSLVGNPVLGAKVGVTAASGAHAYDQIRGAAYRALIEAGMDEETARAAATDEALLSSLLEMGDTVVDLVTLGGSGALNAIGRAAVKSGSKNKAVKALGGYLLNILGESVEEGAQQGVSIANRNRSGSGVGDLFSRTWDTLGNALRGRDPEALLELLTAGKEGAKLAAMLGIPAIAVNTAVGTLSDPLRQVWEEANREVENTGSEGYNENTGNTRTFDAETERNIQGYLEHIVDDAGNVDTAQMGQLRRDIQKGILNGNEIGAISQKMAELGITKEYEAEMRKLNFNEYLRNLTGEPPVDMNSAHAHHILFKTGRGKAQQLLVQEAQELLRRNGIDPIAGPENLVWAPMYAKGQHSLASLKQLVDALKAADAAGGGYDAIVEVLRDFGDTASRRK